MIDWIPTILVLALVYYLTHETEEEKRIREAEEAFEEYNRGNNILRPQEYRVIEDKRRREELRRYLLQEITRLENNPYTHGLFMPDESTRNDYKNDQEYFTAIALHKWLKKHKREALAQCRQDLYRLDIIDEDDFIPDELWQKYEEAIACNTDRS